jgi:hypothetical protein
VADSDDGRDDVEVEEGRRSPPPFSRSTLRDSPQNGKIEDPRSKAGPDRYGRYGVDPTRDIYDVGVDYEISTGVKRVGGEQRTGIKRRAGDKDGDRDFRPVSPPKCLFKR